MTTERADGTPALTPLKRAFLALEEARTRLAALESGQSDPVAIIGVGCRVPGARDPAAFWRLLLSGTDATGEVPPDRWDADAYYDPDPEAEGRITTRRGGFLDDVAAFDAEFFGIAPREAQGLDPQQRLLLEVSWEALEHAGIAADRLEGSATGVYVGMASGDYSNEQIRSGDPALLNAHFTSGIAHSMGSGRLSYLLGLQGPSLTIDTACSSSLVAFHLACQALQAGDCRLALAGGVNLILSPDLAIALSHSRMLAPDGRCKTFDAAADGFARGEGCGMVVLKRLRDAVAEGDRILAVIRGTAVNQDGPSSGLTAPNGPAQEAVIRQAIRRAGLRPQDIGYLEAHGTGTQLGDPLEMGALGNVFGPGRDPHSPLVVGSVKTNLGHLEAAAGVTAVIKVVLSLQARTIPAHLNFRNPSPHIPWDLLPVRVPTTAEAWQPVTGRRIAGVSSFGFSGTNAHVVIEEAPAATGAEGPDSSARPAHLLVLSAREEVALRELAKRHGAALSADGAPSLADACRTAATGRARFPLRAAIVASGVEGMVAGLEAVAIGGAADGVRVARVARPDPPRIAFLFTGQGAQYPGMALGLYETAPAFREALDRCARSLDPLLGRSLLGLLQDGSGVLDETRYTQPVLFAVEYALAELWRRYGIEPTAVMGHSIGEYTAACAAGVLALDDALRLVEARGRLMQALPAGGAMSAIFAPEEAVRSEISRMDGRVAIAAVNAPGQVVISGVAADVAAVSGLFTARGVRTHALPVSHAFHSPLVEPVLDEFEAVADGIAWGTPRTRLISNLTGGLAVGGDLASPSYWRRHMRGTVRFEEGLRTLASLRPDIVIEVGPHPTLLAFAEATLGSGGPHLVPTLRRNRDDWTALLGALGALHLHGASVAWQQVHNASGARVVDLPTYPFQRSRHWFMARDNRVARGARPGHPLLGTRLPSPLPVAVYESAMRADAPAFLGEHVVQGHVVVPATAWLEILHAAGTQALPGRPVALADVTVQQALIVEGTADARRVHTVVEPREGAAELRISSQSASAPAGDPWDCHVTARAVVARPAGGATLARARERCRTPMDVPAFYASFGDRGLAFGPSFHTVRELWRGDGEALGRVALGDPDPMGAAVGMHPVLLDGCVQVLAAAFSPEDATSLFLPVAIGRFTLHERVAGPCWSHAALVGTVGETVAASVNVFDEAGRLVAALEDVRLKRVSADALTRLGGRWLDEALLEVQWPLVEGPESPGAPAWSLPTLASCAGDALAESRAAAGLDAYDAFLPALDALCLDYVEQAMAQLGWQPAPGDVVTPAAVAGDLGVVDRHRRLFARLFEILAEGGLLARAGGGWLVRRRLALGGDPEGTRVALLAAHPLGRAELEMTGRAGSGLAAALRGNCDPMDLLFPAGSLDTAERLYRDSPPAVVMNGMLARVVATALATPPAGRPLRILEVGAGTGGTTAHLIPLLGPNAVDYMFTDVGPLFVARARERFAGVPGMQFGVLDLERSLVEQGFTQGHYDLVIASNVVHATRDLRRTLTRIREVLAPGGLLALLEVTAPQRWFDLTVGLTPGWWAFEDSDLRTGYPALSRDRWLALLGETGFAAAAAVPNGAAPSTGVLGLQALLLGQAGQPQPSSRPTWLVFADGTAMPSLAAALGQRGDRCIVVRPGTAYHEAGDEVMLDPLDPTQYDRLFERHPGSSLSGVIFGWSLSASIGSHSASPVAAHASGFLAATHAAQALLRGKEVPRLWLITRGGQWVTPDDQALEPLQAPVWGLARSLLLEHPELGVTAVDLDPAGVSEDVAGLVDLLDRPPTDPQVALRGGRLRAARLARHRAPAAVAQGPWRLVAPHQTLERMERVPMERSLPGPGCVEIEVEATGLNFKDVLNALGMYPGDPGPLGGECAGRIVAVGSEVDHLHQGDEVVALAPGCFASHVLAHADFVLPRPPQVGVAEAATLPIAFLTGRFALEHVAGLRAGETVLIHAAAGGVGMAAVRIAQRIGAEVHATAGAPWKRDLLRAMGVRHVHDSRSTSFADGILAATAGKGVDVVLNSLAGEMLDASFRVLARGGRFVELGKRGLWSRERVASLGLGHQYHVVDWGETMQRDPALIRSLFVAVLADAAGGSLQPLPRHAFPVEQCAGAFRFMSRARHVGRIVVRQQRAGQAITVSPQGTYLITGGLTGLGLAAARRLAERGAGRIVLIGRRGVPAASRTEVEALGRLTLVETEALDASNEAGMSALLERLRKDGPPLRGVIHSAGVVADAAFLSQDAASVGAVFAPKVVGASLLDRLTRADALDFFVLFSSVAGMLGSAGQANHAGANAFLDLLAARRRSEGLPGLSIAWGPWSDVGAAADRGLAARLAELGLGTVTPGQGLQALERVMGEELVQVAVQPADWHTVLERQPRRAALLGVLASRSAAVSPSLPGAGTRRALREEVALVPAGRVRPVIAAFVREMALNALGLDQARVLDPATPLGDLGLDSLLSVELRNTLGTAIGKPLPATLLFDHPTVDALTDVLVRELGLEGATRPGPSSAPAPGGVLEVIEDLTDEEVDRRLALRSRQR